MTIHLTVKNVIYFSIIIIIIIIKLGIIWIFLFKYENKYLQNKIATLS